MAPKAGQPRSHSSLMTRPRVSDAMAPPLVKLYLSKKNFITSAANTQKPELM